MKKIVSLIILSVTLTILLPGFIALFMKSPEKVQGVPGTTLPETADTEKVSLANDRDGDGITDLSDILEGARMEAESMPVYKNAYYIGGYPPSNEGVCTDLIWRAFMNAGFDLKDMIDKDIMKNIKDYPAVNGKPDPNIDFRRVRNLYVFFKKYGQNLTTEIIPNDKNNTSEWQGGDIVTFENPGHIAIVSDKRRADGVPYIIHNTYPNAQESDELLYWVPNITGHFRYPKK